MTVEAPGGNEDEKFLGMLDESKGELLTSLLLICGIEFKVFSWTNSVFCTIDEIFFTIFPFYEQISWHLKAASLCLPSGFMLNRATPRWLVPIHMSN